MGLRDNTFGRVHRSRDGSTWSAYEPAFGDVESVRVMEHNGTVLAFANGLRGNPSDWWRPPAGATRYDGRNAFVARGDGPKAAALVAHLGGRVVPPQRRRGMPRVLDRERTRGAAGGRGLAEGVRARRRHDGASPDARDDLGARRRRGALRRAGVEGPPPGTWVALSASLLAAR